LKIIKLKKRKKKKRSIKKKIDKKRKRKEERPHGQFDICLLSGVDTCPTVNFFMEKLTKILIRSFSKPQVPYVI
jgi:hypothetical protein